MTLEYADGKRTGRENYRRKISLLGKQIADVLPPLAIALAMRKNSELGEIERRLDESEKLQR